MFSYDTQDRDFKEGHKLFLFYQDDTAIGSIFLDERMESDVKHFIQKLNEFSSPANQRTREGIQTITGTVG